MTSQHGQHASGNQPGGDPERLKVVGVNVLFMLTLPIIVIAVILVGPPVSEKTGDGSVVAYDSLVEPVSPGEQVYMDTCKVCHGPDAKGIVGLGKPLVNTSYVLDNDDAELFDNIANGRMPDDPANTTGMAMPARGAQGISDEQIHEVIAYIRTLQDPSAPRASMDAWIVERPSPSDAGGEGDGVEVMGRDLFVSACSACHGPNGEGMEGLGKPFTTSQFVKDASDKELLTMIKMGRPVWDAANTTGVDMPPKGGNPAITDEELMDIITYIRSIDTAD